MADNELCRAIKRNGEQCQYPAKFAGFCGVHFPKSEKREKTLKDRLSTASLVVGLLGGSIKLVEKFIDVWQGLAFGSGPRMPSDYDYLVGEFGPRYPTSLSSMPVGTWGTDSIPWEGVRRAYDYARISIKRLESEEISEADLDKIKSDMNKIFSIVYDQMDSRLRETLFQLIDEENNENELID